MGRLLLVFALCCLDPDVYAAQPVPYIWQEPAVMQPLYEAAAKGSRHEFAGCVVYMEHDATRREALDFALEHGCDVMASAPLPGVDLRMRVSLK